MHHFNCKILIHFFLGGVAPSLDPFPIGRGTAYQIQSLVSEPSLWISAPASREFQPDLCRWECCVDTLCALTLLVGWQEGRPACKKLEWWGTGLVICLERGADLHLAQLMPLPLTVSCFSKIQIGFTFLVPAHLGSPGKRAVKRVCVRVLWCVCV